MSTPMAVLEMEPVEVDKEETTDPADWAWTPKLKDGNGLIDAMKMSQQSSMKTGSQKTDFGEGK